MASVKQLNPNADITRSTHALAVNISAAKSLQQLLKSNLGPRGTMKMLVGGAGDIKITKDGNILLHEMQIKHPTASLIARASTAQDDITGDGTTSSVLLIGEILRQCERFLSENVHPRVLSDGFEIARGVAIEALDAMRITKAIDKDILESVARTSLRTKVAEKIADQLSSIVVDSVLCIQREEEPIDLFMVEIMEMQHRSGLDTQLIKGLVLDHGPRHPLMPTKLENCHILTCNISMEYEKSTVDASLVYNSASQREKLADAERKFTDDKVRKIIELKREVCKPNEGFVVVNMHGIDPASLDLLAKEGILALRRAKRRNMERLTLCSGGIAVNSAEALTPDVLGFAKSVHVHTLGEEKYTFIEGVSNPRSCTILIRGPNNYTIHQIKDAIRDGLRAVKNTIDDQCVVPGGGAFEVGAYRMLMKFKDTMKGRKKLGVQVYAEALLVIPKTLAANSGFDPQETILKVVEEQNDGHIVGVDVVTGEPFDPIMDGVFDNYRVKRQQLHLSSILASQILLVDEIMQAGKSAGGGPIQQ